MWVFVLDLVFFHSYDEMKDVLILGFFGWFFQDLGFAFDFGLESAEI